MILKRDTSKIVPQTVLVIDNFDSFVYNLMRYINELGFKTQVKRNNAVTIVEIVKNPPSHILISPGPCTPNEAGISLDIIRYFAGKIPILGVCLGHQAIAQVFGGKVVRAKYPMHGKASMIRHHEKNLFANIENPLQVARYHSLIVDEEHLPKSLMIDARCERGEIMAISHQEYAVYGVQFHPESVLTRKGYEILNNFLQIKTHTENLASENALPTHQYY